MKYSQQTWDETKQKLNERLEQLKNAEKYSDASQLWEVAKQAAQDLCHYDCLYAGTLARAESKSHMSDEDANEERDVGINALKEQRRLAAKSERKRREAEIKAIREQWEADDVNRVLDEAEHVLKSVGLDAELRAVRDKLKRTPRASGSNDEPAEHPSLDQYETEAGDPTDLKGLCLDPRDASDGAPTDDALSYGNSSNDDIFEPRPPRPNVPKVSPTAKTAGAGTERISEMQQPHRPSDATSRASSIGSIGDSEMDERQHPEEDATARMVTHLEPRWQTTSEGDSRVSTASARFPERREQDRRRLVDPPAPAGPELGAPALGIEEPHSSGLSLPAGLGLSAVLLIPCYLLWRLTRCSKARKEEKPRSNEDLV